MSSHGSKAPEWISTQPALTEFCSYIRTIGRFAFDTEFIMESSYHTQICLVQLAAGERVGLVDPLSVEDLGPVWDLVCDPDIVCIVHAGSEDLNLCFHESHRLPARVFDVQIAAGLVGYAYPISLMKLSREAVGARLHKTQTLTNWMQRPLTASQIEYARDDVGFLPAIHDHIVERLQQLGRAHWAREEFGRFERWDYYVRDAEDELFRMKGAGGLDRLELAIARELLLARDQIAERLDRPPRVIIKDYLLAEIAKHRWAKIEQIRTLRGLSLPAWALQQLVAAAERGLNAPKEEWPALPPSNEETDEMAILTSLLTAVLREFCLRNALAYSLLTTKPQLSRIAADFLRRGDLAELPIVLGRWRTDAVGEVIHKVLLGGARIKVVPKGTGVQLDIAS